MSEHEEANREVAEIDLDFTEPAEPDTDPQAEPDPSEPEAGAADGADGADDTAPAMDWSKVDPAAIPHEVVQKTAAFRGILNETQTLRDVVRALKPEAAQPAATAEDDTAGPEDIDLPDDEIMTAGMWRKLQQAQAAKAAKAEQERQQAAQAQQQHHQAVAAKVQEFLGKHDRAGTPEDVHPRQLLARLGDRIPKYIIDPIIANSATPGEDLYRALLMYVPEARQAVAKRRGPAPTAGRIPGVSSAAGAPSQPQTPLQSLVRASPEQLSQELDDFFTVPTP